MQDVFAVRLAPYLHAGVRILDIGAGASPTVPPAERPPKTVYVGLDRSADGLRSADPGAYDEALIQDIRTPLEREAWFDLAVSWQVFEHVRGLDLVIENARRALKPGGALVAQLSGSNAIFSQAARIIPHRARTWAMRHWLDHDHEGKFPLEHERRTAGRLEQLLRPWSTAEIVPYYRGATYLGAWRLLQRAYLRYENAIARRDMRNLATHYLVIATR
jgi:SAM-dependent methyltransferase